MYPAPKKEPIHQKNEKRKKKKEKERKKRTKKKKEKNKKERKMHAVPRSELTISAYNSELGIGTEKSEEESSWPLWKIGLVVGIPLFVLLILLGYLLMKSKATSSAPNQATN